LVQKLIVLNRHNAMAEGEISFGRFRLDSARRELRRGDEPVQLGGRGIDILCVLASAEGTLASKDELMARVWGGVVVEENNLQVHISALRKALEGEKTGERWINTGPGRSYLLRPTAPFQRSACHRYCGQTGTLGCSTN
jgi:DNA-binding winged helix-turn-helix (wHTH) protein